jgi:hypothetical protein
MEAKEVLGVTPDVVDLDVMLNTPVPFAKFKGKEYCIKAATLEQVSRYMKELPIPAGDSAFVFVLGEDSTKALEKVFNDHVTCDGKPVKFADVKGVWPDTAFVIFVKKLLKISG